MPQPISPEQKHEWKERIRLQKESGQTALSWCHQLQVNYNLFLYWRRRFGLAPTRTLTRSSYLELPDSSNSPGITIEYQQIQIHLAKDFDPAVLMKCLRALKAERC